jgi:hypothetical protein
MTRQVSADVEAPSRDILSCRSKRPRPRRIVPSTDYRAERCASNSGSNRSRSSTVLAVELTAVKVAAKACETRRRSTQSLFRFVFLVTLLLTCERNTETKETRNGTSQWNLPCAVVGLVDSLTASPAVPAHDTYLEDLDRGANNLPGGKEQSWYPRRKVKSSAPWREALLLLLLVISGVSSV